MRAITCVRFGFIWATFLLYRSGASQLEVRFVESGQRARALGDPLERRVAVAPAGGERRGHTLFFTQHRTPVAGDEPVFAVLAGGRDLVGKQSQLAHGAPPKVRYNPIIIQERRGNFYL